MEVEIYWAKVVLAVGVTIVTVISALRTTINEGILAGCWDFGLSLFIIGVVCTVWGMINKFFCDF